jgi:hypothetical protein
MIPSGVPRPGFAGFVRLPSARFPTNTSRLACGAVSCLLLSLTLPVRRRLRIDDAAGNLAADAREGVARVWWTAALETGLPPGALAAAGCFIRSALPEEVRLPLARRSAEPKPPTRTTSTGSPNAPPPTPAASTPCWPHLPTRPALVEPRVS